MPNPTTTERPVIDLPREEGESARAYAGRVEYVTMGPGRSFDRLLKRYQSATNPPPTKRRDTLVDWSTRYGWVEHAARYDEQVQYLTLQEAAESYRRDLEDHRKRYGDAGKALYGVAAQVLKQLSQVAAQQPREIKGADGKTYKVPGIELTPATLTVVSRAMTIAADLEAHALRLGDILPKLDGGDGSP